MVIIHAKDVRIARDYNVIDMRLTRVYACSRTFSYFFSRAIRVFSAKNSWQNRVSVLSYFLQVSVAYFAATEYLGV